jgi:hypothetical protein
VPQPAYDPAKPHLVYPPKVYETMLRTPDEVIARLASYAAPPVPQPAA